MAEIRLEGVGKTYPDGTEAVRDLSLEIADGALAVLLGPSGCGKTTALRMVAGLEEITKGTISIGDQVINELHPGARDIAMVFQNYALYPHLSVAENIGFPLKLARVRRRERDSRVREVARLLGLEEHLKRRPRQLSGGQRQRVAMGRALIRQPRAFLMDEPLSNLDAKLRVQMRAEISNLQRQLGVTTLYVTHDQVEAMTMGDVVAVMRHGRLQQFGPPQVIYDNPENLFVAGFIGNPPMNLFEAELVDDDRVAIGDQTIALDEDERRRLARSERLRGRLILGIRPEKLHDRWSVDEGPNREIRGTLIAKESLGSDLLVNFVVAGLAPLSRSVDALTREIEDPSEVESIGLDQPDALLTGRFDPHSPIRLGAEVRVEVALNSLHFFDPESGRCLSNAPSPTPLLTK